ncbi:YhdP family protein [Luteimonas vadosa]
MPTPVRRRLRLARRGAWYAVAGLLVLMALVAGVASTLLPLLERHPERIEAWLSVRAGRPVEFDQVSTQWTRRGPLLRVDGLRVGSGRDAVPIGEAEILVSQYAGLLPGRSFTELRLRGLELTLERADDGRWHVHGLPGQAVAGADPLDALRRLGELQVIDGQLTVIARALGIQATLPRVDMRLRVQGSRVRAAVRAWMHEGRVPLDGVLDFDRDGGDGRVHVSARDADLSEWSPLLHLDGIRLERGKGDAALWAELRDSKLAQVTVDADLHALHLVGAGEGQGASRPAAGFERFTMRARWHLVDGGWRVDVPSASVQAATAGAPQVIEGMVLAGGTRQALLAERLDIAPMLSLASLSPRLSASQRQWLQAARPGATLRDLVAARSARGPVRVEATVQALSFASVGDAPGIAGLAGRVRGDGAGVVFDVDPTRPVRLDWPRAFAVSHDMRVDGRLVGWRAGPGWQVHAPALRVRGRGYGVDLRGGLALQGDGTLPILSIAARIDDSEMVAAKGFWVRHKMPGPAVRWLDDAVQGGKLRNGRAVLSGDLDDWPFRGGTGLFLADTDLEDAVVKFLPDWPEADRMQAHAVFDAEGFSVSGSAALAGVEVRRFEAGIARFGESPLQIEAEAVDDAGAMLDMLRQSPFRVEHGETLQALRASGAASATFALELPVHLDAAKPRIAGNVELRGVKLADTRWDLAFSEVRGKARYDRDGFTATNLKARRDGQPGAISLRAGASHVRDARQAFEAELETTLGAGELLQRAPELAWLRPYLSGRSAWTVGLEVPATRRPAQRAASAPPAKLRLRSDLVGTQLQLPAPLAKAAATALPVTVETRLPLGEGEITVALGQRLALRAGTRNGRTGVRAVLGGASVASPPPAHGLVATGSTDEFDAIGWAALASTGGDRPGGPAAGASGPQARSGDPGLPLREVDITSRRLQLLGGTFPDTRLRARPAAAGTGVQFEGPALAGALLLPDAEGAALAGRLQRLHWRNAKAGTTEARPGQQGPAQVDADAPTDDGVDPARLPPLNVFVDDLRVGEARLGSASLQARPIASGMRIERLQTRAPKQRIDMSGEWTGRGASARTSLQALLASEDFGALLGGFGFGGRIDEGHGQAEFDVQWLGSPAQFRLDALQGHLALTVKDGQLVEIEPGAGRVLGLLSVAELPRRLTLDFRDFFSKGFSFNRIDGNLRFGSGKARSDDLVIDGPAAEIRISGAADLRAQTFDQTIEVLPKAGNLLTAVGAITAGPVGAAVGAVANAVLRKPLSEMNAKTYRVTGPWKDPKVEVTAKAAQEPRKQASAGAATPPG